MRRGWCRRTETLIDVGSAVKSSSSASSVGLFDCVLFGPGLSWVALGLFEP